jgi:hypothetical protein
MAYMKKSEWFRVSPPEIGLDMPYMKEELSSHGRSHWFKSGIAKIAVFEEKKRGPGL